MLLSSLKTGLSHHYPLLLACCKLKHKFGKSFWASYLMIRLLSLKRKGLEKHSILWLILTLCLLINWLHSLFACRNLIRKFYPSLWSLFKGKEYYDLDTLDWFSVTHSYQILQPNLWNRTIPFAKIIMTVGYLVLCLYNELPTMPNKPQVGHKYLPNVFAQ